MKDDTVELLTSWMPFNYTQEMIKESRETNGGKILMKGILQKADTLNQNGRIYPKAILDREVRNYQKFIRERRALGECVDPDTFVCTAHGAIPIADIQIGDMIYTMNMETNEIISQPVLSKIERYHSGKMIHATANHLDMFLTNNHKVILRKENSDENYFIYANELKDADNKLSRIIGNTEYHTVCEMKIEEVEYSGKVHCVTVENGTWLAERKGFKFWTGNCDHPESSVVELKNASHLIVEAHMTDGVVYGTVELLNTPSGKILQALVESNVTLGISSRGVGSTRREGERQIVQDDFQLICWDYVSEPSTPGAFMMKEAKTIDRRIVEKFFKKSDKIDRIFNEILDWEK